MFLDKIRGTMLKIDRYGYILRGTHGKRVIPHSQLKEMYPSMQVHSDDIGQRFYLLNTLFNVVDACLYADLVEFLEKKEAADQAHLQGEVLRCCLLPPCLPACLLACLLAHMRVCLHWLFLIPLLMDWSWRCHRALTVESIRKSGISRTPISSMMCEVQSTTYTRRAR